jgi:hypothetical protein
MHTTTTPARPITRLLHLAQGVAEVLVGDAGGVRDSAGLRPPV